MQILDLDWLAEPQTAFCVNSKRAHLTTPWGRATAQEQVLAGDHKPVPGRTVYCISQLLNLSHRLVDVIVSHRHKFANNHPKRSKMDRVQYYTQLFQTSKF